MKIAEFLVPKTEAEILNDISCLKSPVERFTNLLCFHIGKSQYEIINNNLINKCINLSYNKDIKFFITEQHTSRETITTILVYNKYYECEQQEITIAQYYYSNKIVININKH